MWKIEFRQDWTSSRSCRVPSAGAEEEIWPLLKTSERLLSCGVTQVRHTPNNGPEFGGGDSQSAWELATYRCSRPDTGGRPALHAKTVLTGTLLLRSWFAACATIKSATTFAQDF